MMPPPAVIVADDDADDRMLVGEALESVGIAPAFVHDGTELVALLREDHVGCRLILLDMNMPRLDGPGALVAIRDELGLAALPVVVLSTSRAPSDVAMMLRLGADEFKVKPDSFDELLDLVADLRDRYLGLEVPS